MISHLDSEGVNKPPQRLCSSEPFYRFLAWTALWWGGTAICLCLFFAGVMSFRTSTKTSLYFISVWLNGWLLALLKFNDDARNKFEVLHDCLVLWLLTYAITNIIWEIPWVLCSPFVFENVNTESDLVGHTEYMRSSVFHMYFWMLASFGSVDLRTVNHNSTFFTLELYSFVNVATTMYFFYLNKKRSPHRYLVVIAGCGEPVAATFIFSFTEVVAGFPNMVGGVADTLLALVWTQYQYIIFPLIFGYVGYVLLREDWRLSNSGQSNRETEHLLNVNI